MTTRSPRPRPPKRKSNRVGFIALGVMAVAVAVGLFLLFGGSSESSTDLPEQEIAELQFMDGTLSVVSDERLVLVSFDRDEEVEFLITDADRSNFDIAHMQSHSSIALPTRIYYEDDGGTLYARYKEDAPVNSQDAG